MGARPKNNSCWNFSGTALFIKENADFGCFHRFRTKSLDNICFFLLLSLCVCSRSKSRVNNLMHHGWQNVPSTHFILENCSEIDFTQDCRPLLIAQCPPPSGPINPERSWTKGYFHLAQGFEQSLVKFFAIFTFMHCIGKMTHHKDLLRTGSVCNESKWTGFGVRN